MTFNELRDACVVAEALDEAGMTGPATELRQKIILTAVALLNQPEVA